MELVAVVFVLKLWWHFLCKIYCEIFSYLCSLQYFFICKFKIWESSVGFSFLKIMISAFFILRERLIWLMMPWAKRHRIWRIWIISWPRSSLCPWKISLCINEKLGLIFIHPGVFFIFMEARSYLMEQNQVHQFDDDRYMVICDKVLRGKAKSSSLNSDVVLSISDWF